MIFLLYHQYGYRISLYNPTSISKIGDVYFISDCDQHRIIYSKSLKFPVVFWRTLTSPTINQTHSIASDGEIYLADNTVGNGLVIIKKKNDHTFMISKEIFEVNGEPILNPHYCCYDSDTALFYVLQSNGEILVFENLDGELKYVDNHSVLEQINRRGYTRSFSIIEGRMYMPVQKVGIVEIDYLNDFKVAKVYKVPKKISGMNQLAKIGDNYYLTIYTDAEYNKEARDLITFKHFDDLYGQNYTSIADRFPISSTPYYISEIENRFFIAFLDEKQSAIFSFDIDRNGELYGIKEEKYYKEREVNVKRYHTR